MDGLFWGAVKSLAIGLGQGGIFAVFISLTVIAFVINLFLSCFKTDYGILRRLWQPFLSVGLIFICKGICNLAGYGEHMACFIAGFSALSFIPTLLIRVKKFKVTERQRDLVKFIDSQINAEKENSDIRDKISCENHTINQTKGNCASDFEVDFKHVKNVIARLDYFGLKECDKRQVKELENALLMAEKGEFNQDVKCKINDGLGALLRIMSKYGV